MAMKEYLQWVPPLRSLTALLLSTLSVCFRLAACHFTRSPTLLVDACHALCRLLGLVTTLVAFKFERADVRTGREGRLRNTFGWARIEVVGRLSVHVLFASFALALLVSALQLGVHHAHVQPPRLPTLTVTAAVAGLFAHFVCYLLLGGRELSYSRRLSVTEGGAVVLRDGGGRGEPVLAHAPTDIASSLFAMAAGLVTEWFGDDVARWADPAISAVAGLTLVALNYHLMRSAGLVLLQTVPEGLGACALREAALRVPGVLALHELHVWQLHRDRLVATAHVFYSSQQDYMKSSGMVTEIFKKYGIGLVTLQPEFAQSDDGGLGVEELGRLIEAAGEACGRPCARSCTAPRCCLPPALAPAPTPAPAPAPIPASKAPSTPSIEAAATQPASPHLALNIPPAAEADALGATEETPVVSHTVCIEETAQETQS